MRYFRITADPGIHWGLVSEDSAGFCCSNGPFIAEALGAVRDAFLAVFGPETVNSHPTLAVISMSEGPMTLRELNLIALSSKGARYLQHIYQFSHELCHFMVPGNVCGPYRWFEEPLCETMSWYALQWIADNRARYTRASFASLIDGIGDYISQCQAVRAVFDGPPSSYLPQYLEHLKGSPYDRALNSAVAYAIYPFFLQTPVLWKIVLFLNTLKPDMSLKDALSHLFRIAAIPDDPGNKIVQALCE